jgi:rod shape-determining protein MreC
VRNRFVKIFALVAVFVVVFYSVIAVMGFTSVGQNILGVAATPFRWALSFAGNTLGGFGDYFTEFNRLKEENEELANRVAELEAKQAHLEDIEGENAWMREFLSVGDSLSEFEMVNAHVIGKEANSYMTLYTLNKGSLSGIERDMAVVSNGSVVGRVESVGLNWCKVTTILENASSVGAVCARSGARGIVDGSLGLRGDGTCSMNYINEFADVQIGDKIITSGAGTVYPYGFNIGTVVGKSFDEHTRTVSAVIKPDVDFDEITRVMIVKRK